jgi:hypothetical protein
VAQPFLEDPGLPFAQVLPAEAIEEAFAARQGLFGLEEDEVFSTPLVLWAFLAQVLRDGKGAACAAAVADIAAYMQQTGGPVPCGDTGDYCRARAKLSLPALRELSGRVAEGLEGQADPSWLWHGLHATLIDGFTFTMADTEKNQRVFPQPSTQNPGLGQPIARACGVLSLSTAAIHDLAIGPYQGKETGESALLRTLLEGLKPGDVAVFDRCVCSYMMIALLQLRGVEVCARLHQLRRCDFRRGERLGKDDHLVTWTRPARPEWMAPEEYERIPLTLTLRELRFQVTEPGRRTETITVVTTLTDPEAYPKEDIATLYGFRWNAELDIRAIKQTLNLDHVPCKSPEMVQLHLWMTLLAYNLVRRLIGVAAKLHDRQPRELGFTFACQTILAHWMLVSTGQWHNARQAWAGALKRIAANEVANRPGRIEPRAIKRRTPGYPWLTLPRQAARAKCLGR